VARFRLVDIDNNGNIIEHYRSEMFLGDKWNKDFDKDYADCLWYFSDDLHLVDYENASPNLETQITYDDKIWEYMSDPIEDFYNL
jgi:hypothetical protein